MATILEGLNAISQAVGGAGEAESNLEALNQISEALGGSADATENAEAIANIAENASGGGGSDLALVNVTITNNRETALSINLPVVDTDEFRTSPSVVVNSGETKTAKVPIVSGGNASGTVPLGTNSIAVSGLVYKGGSNPATLTVMGEGTITIS